MRINDLSKELGKKNKELIEFLSENGAGDRAPMSNVSEREAELIRNHFKPKKTEAQVVKKTETSEAAKQETRGAETVSTAQTAGTSGAEQSTEAPKKKKFTAVFRPQNAQQIRVKPKAAAPKQRAAVQPEKEAGKPAEKVLEKQRSAEGNAAETVGKVSNTAVPAQAGSEAKKAEGRSAAQESAAAARHTGEAAKQETASAASSPAGTAAAPAASGDTAAAAAKATVPAAPARPSIPAGSIMRNGVIVSLSSMQGGRTPSRSPQGGYNRAQGDRAQGGYNRAQGDRAQGGYNRMQGDRAQGGYNRAQGDRAQGGYNRAQGDRPQGGRGGSFQARPGSGFDNRRSGNFTSRGAAGDTPLVKKPVSNRPSKNNFKDKNDKRHKTEDGFKANGKGGKVTRHPFIMPEKPKAVKVEEAIREIVLPESITISDLAKKMKKNASELIKKLFAKGELYTINTEISYEKAEELALEYEILCTPEEKIDVIEELLKEETENVGEMVSRPPVVCVMGHVDHGKTSLLDAIRKTSVTSREAGGITQHIGAYMVKVGDRPITFLDTPGHEAFTAMRLRGAQATDIAVLVVAADDGIMPQTVEAINHAKAAGVDIIVAINKIDKPAANIERVKQELMQYELISEDWGGSTICCPISAKTHEGIENLLEMILLTADVKELKANPNRNARGLVIEAQLDKGKGPVATVLVQKGTLHVGDFVAAGSCYGKIRAMLNDRGMRVKEAKPSTPVEIQGLSAVPNAGEIFVAMDSDKEAKDFAATFVSEGKNKLIEETKAKLSLDDLFGQIRAGEVKELPLIVKADVQGSVEAVKQSLSKLSNEEVQVRVIHSAVGAISESDVSLASASNAIIIGFNVRPDTTAKSIAEHEHVDVRLYKVIYQAIEDIERALQGMLEPVFEEKVIGHAEVRALFKASGIGTIAGAYILDGKIQRGCKARITRDGEQIFDGELASLKRFKDDVKEVNAGYECGLVFEKFNDLMEGDQVEAYAMVEVSRK